MRHSKKYKDCKVLIIWGVCLLLSYKVVGQTYQVVTKEIDVEYGGKVTSHIIRGSSPHYIELENQYQEVNSYYYYQGQNVKDKITVDNEEKKEVNGKYYYTFESISNIRHSGTFSVSGFKEGINIKVNVTNCVQEYSLTGDIRNKLIQCSLTLDAADYYSYTPWDKKKFEENGNEYLIHKKPDVVKWEQWNEEHKRWDVLSSNEYRDQVIPQTWHNKITLSSSGYYRLYLKGMKRLDRCKEEVLEEQELSLEFQVYKVPDITYETLPSHLQSISTPTSIIYNQGNRGIVLKAGKNCEGYDQGDRRDSNNWKGVLPKQKYIEIPLAASVIFGVQAVGDYSTCHKNEDELRSADVKLYTANENGNRNSEVSPDIIDKEYNKSYIVNDFNKFGKCDLQSEGGWYRIEVTNGFVASNTCENGSYQREDLIGFAHIKEIAPPIVETGHQESCPLTASYGETSFTTEELENPQLIEDSKLSKLECISNQVTKASSEPGAALKITMWYEKPRGLTEDAKGECTYYAKTDISLEGQVSGSNRWLIMKNGKIYLRNDEPSVIGRRWIEFQTTYPNMSIGDNAEPISYNSKQAIWKDISDDTEEEDKNYGYIVVDTYPPYPMVSEYNQTEHKPIQTYCLSNESSINVDVLIPYYGSNESNPEDLEDGYFNMVWEEFDGEKFNEVETIQMSNPNNGFYKKTFNINQLSTTDRMEVKDLYVRVEHVQTYKARGKNFKTIQSGSRTRVSVVSNPVILPESACPWIVTLRNNLPNLYTQAYTWHIQWEYNDGNDIVYGNNNGESNYNKDFTVDFQNQHGLLVDNTEVDCYFDVTISGEEGGYSIPLSSLNLSDDEAKTLAGDWEHVQAPLSCDPSLTRYFSNDYKSLYNIDELAVGEGYFSGDGRCDESKALPTGANRVDGFTLPFNVDVESETFTVKNMVSASSSGSNDVLGLSATAFRNNFTVSTEELTNSVDLEFISKGSLFANGQAGVWRNQSSFAHNPKEDRYGIHSSDLNELPDNEVLNNNDGSNSNIKNMGYIKGNPFGWKYNGVITPADWIKTDSITKYSAGGFPVESVNALGIHSSAVYAYNKRLPIAVAANARQHEILFTSFEEEDRGAFLRENDIFKKAVKWEVLAGVNNKLIINEEYGEIEPIYKAMIESEKLVPEEVEEEEEVEEVEVDKCDCANVNSLTNNKIEEHVFDDGLVRFNANLTGVVMEGENPQMFSANARLLCIATLKKDEKEYTIAGVEAFGAADFPRWKGEITVYPRAETPILSVEDLNNRLTVYGDNDTYDDRGTVENQNDDLKYKHVNLGYRFDNSNYLGSQAIASSYGEDDDDEKQYIHSGKRSLELTGGTTYTLPQPIFMGGTRYSVIKGTPKKYRVSAWIKVKHEDDTKLPAYDYGASYGIKILLSYTTEEVTEVKVLSDIKPSGMMVEGWQQVNGIFTLEDDPSTVDVEENVFTDKISIQFFKKENETMYVDDIRVYPADGSLQTYVYDPITYRVEAVHDANNFATFYYYDEEGKLYLIKKETERGVKTIQESVQYTIERDETEQTNEQ